MRNAPLIFSLCALFCAVLFPGVRGGAEDLDSRAWFKGNTHTHTLWSDGNDFPESVIDWYHRSGYDFVALSDHNILQVGEKWMDVEAIKKRQRALGVDAISKCVARFGEEWIQWETREDKKGIVLKTLDQCREMFDEPGKFYLLMAEEISNSARDNAPIHINALNHEESIPAIKDDSASAEEVMRRTFLAVRQREAETGRPILAHLNHPNFRWAVTADDLARVAEGGFVEVYNGHPAVNHLGDENRPGEEAIWDIANTIRLAEMEIPPLYGVATDDSHTYHGGDVSPGRGWVFVGAKSLNGDAIVEAMRAGHFYASSGVVVDRIHFDSETGTLSLEFRPEEGVVYTTRFVGTRRGYDAAAEETGIGEVFATMEGNAASFAIPDDAYYLRATITSSRPHPNPSFQGQLERAWIQPVGWKVE